MADSDSVNEAAVDYIEAKLAELEASKAHSDEWHEGHAIGYQASLEDIYEWAQELETDWSMLGGYTAEELVAFRKFLEELRIRTFYVPRETTDD